VLAVHVFIDVLAERNVVVHACLPLVERTFYLILVVSRGPKRYRREIHTAVAARAMSGMGISHALGSLDVLANRCGLVLMMLPLRSSSRRTAMMHECI
jgi:hypothetical protein